jgi:hypothetical protein
LLSGLDAVPETDRTLKITAETMKATGSTLKTGIRKSKTTKESINKRNVFVVFENQKDMESQSHSESRSAGGWVWRSGTGLGLAQARRPVDPRRGLGPPDEKDLRK